MAKKTLDIDVVREIALTLPDVVESTIHGAPSWKVRGKLLACPAFHSSAEPNSIAVRLDCDQRDRLIAAAPLIYYLTEHYANHPIVLVRLSRIDRTAFSDLLSMAWRLVSSPKKTTGRKGRSQGGGTAE
ncbi:MmcQ/YjbR family DNA-binding protein [Prosthecobacter sp.]|uniref:MmcQ/YjbR family DNA-binding protein n=1 Tax=Prosthecobacter sp. TaxID=1965333 RepID=UPI002ABCAC33|nr:MmcQ/YjbR family DNA-binding protein [Prosthecobacter sp.]MDZ4404323.1 hypothetical protein [Prosthecobacter sp.]